MAESNTSLERTSPQLIPLPPKARAVLDGLRQRWYALPAHKQKVIGGSALFVAVTVALAAWWSGRTDWRVLYNGLAPRDLQQVEQQLGAAGVTYQTSADGGALQVPVEELAKARMAVAAKGMPSSGRMGFELFDKPNWVGSEFDERVNYQRALEGELEHTIETIDAVESVRVHLVMPKQSYFAAEQHAATASVVLKLRRASMSREQVSSIRTLVAGAVENLSPDQVTLIDADGRADFGKPSQTGTAHEEESALEAKLIAMLEPVAGAGNVRATVNITYDQGTEERTDETYDPQSAVQVSVQRSEQSSLQSQKTASGPVGTASNTASTANPIPVTPVAGNGQQQTSREENSAFAVSRHVVRTQEGPGRVRRIAAAVVVNDAPVADASGNRSTQWRQRTPDDMRRLEQLAQAAVGFDVRRGDAVVVQNLAFTSNAPEPKLGLAERLNRQTGSILRSQPGLIRLAGTVVGIGLLVMCVLRPVSKSISKTLLDAPKALVEPQRGAEAALRPGGSFSVGDDKFTLSKQAGTADRLMFESVANHVRDEGMHSARVLQTWISSARENE